MKRTSKPILLSILVFILAIMLQPSSYGQDSEKESRGEILPRLPDLDREKLDIKYNFVMPKPIEPYSDEKRGIFMKAGSREVIPKNKEKEEIILGGGSGTEEYFEDGLRWLRFTDKSTISASTPEGIGVIIRSNFSLRICFTPENVSHLIKSSSLPPYLRWFAVHNMHRLSFSPIKKLALLERASRDVHANIRYEAIEQLKEFYPQREAIPIYCRALTDPCIDLGYKACRPIIDYFKFEVKTRGMPAVGTGPRWGWYSVKHDRILEVARKVNKRQPWLLTKSDIEIIEGMKEPSEEWWKAEYWHEGRRKLYRKWYYERVKKRSKSNEGKKAPDSDSK